MLKLKIVLSFSLSCIFCYTAFSQNIEVNTFKKVCSQLVKQNLYWINKQKLSSLTILDNPSSGEKILDYKFESPEVIEFNKFSKNEQQEILNARKLPIFPLKDTIYILDKNGLFSKNLHWAINRTYFKAIDKETYRKSTALIIINGMALRDENLILSFGYPKIDLITNFYFKLVGSELEIERTTTFDPNKMDW